ncbi:MAG: phosphate ABC transporter permease PstA [Candidatus Aminicenantes bacterium]|nr:phosphate ABC transporter permease PstA [Candidatus Aminicenantes bacterium]
MTPGSLFGQRRRRFEEKFFKGLMYFSILLVVGSLLLIVLTIIWKGLPSLSLSMITQTPRGGYYLGKEGGILNAIVGSLYLAGGATLLAILLSLPVVLYLNLYTRAYSPLANFVRFSFDVLWGIPSIVFGAFGFVIMVFLGIKTSLLAGIITVALLEFPIMSRAIDEVVRLVPRDLKDASYSLGATKLETALKVVFKQSLPGIVTGVLIAFGRGIGDAASVLFTAGFTDRVPTSLFQPAATLPLAIFFQLGTPFPEVRQRAYASAAVLTILILVISLVSRSLVKRYTKHTIT